MYYSLFYSLSVFKWHVQTQNEDLLILGRFVCVRSMFIYELWYQCFCITEQIVSVWLFEEVYQVENYTEEDTESFSSFICFSNIFPLFCWCELLRKLTFNKTIWPMYFPKGSIISLFLNWVCFIITFCKYYVICGVKFHLKNVDCLALCLANILIILF